MRSIVKEKSRDFLPFDKPKSAEEAGCFNSSPSNNSCEYVAVDKGNMGCELAARTLYRV